MIQSGRHPKDWLSGGIPYAVNQLNWSAFPFNTLFGLSSVPAHKEKLTTGELLSPAETAVYRQCVGGLLHYTQDRADAQYEVSILGSMLGKPTEGSMICSETRDTSLEGNETLCQQT